MRKITLLVAILLTGFLSVFAHAADADLITINENSAGAQREPDPRSTTADQPQCNDEFGRCPMPYHHSELTQTDAADQNKVNGLLGAAKRGDHNGGSTQQGIK